MPTPRNRRRPFGFTVIELLVVLAAIGLLLSIAAPRYLQHLETAKEVTLKQDLQLLRDAIDKFYSDHGKYPTSLDELVAKRYLRSVPVDPVSDRSDTWAPVAAGEGAGGINDVRSGAKGLGRDGKPYATW